MSDQLWRETGGEIPADAKEIVAEDHYGRGELFLTRVAAGALLIEDREQAIERMLRYFVGRRVPEGLDGAIAFLDGLLAAAEGRET